MEHTAKNTRRTRGSSGRVLSRETKENLLPLFCAAALLGVCVAFIVAVGRSIGWGLDFSDGIRCIYAIDTQDTAAENTTDISDSILRIVQARLHTLDILGVRASFDDDERFIIDYPASVYSEELEKTLSQSARFEVVRLDDISDGEAIAKLQNGTTGFMLDSEAYTPILGPDDIATYEVVPTTYTIVDNQLDYLYGYCLTLQEEGTEILEEITAELAPVSGSLVLLLNGEVLYVGGVSETIDTGVLVAYLALDEADAQSQIDICNLGILPASLTLSETSSAPGLYAKTSLTTLLAVTLAAAVLLGLVLCVTLRLLGFLTFLCGCASAIYETGILCIFTRLGMFELTMKTLVFALVGGVAVFAFMLFLSLRFKKSVTKGRSPRNASKQFVDHLLKPFNLIACGLLVIYLLAILVSGSLLVISVCCVCAAVALCALGGIYLLYIPAIRLNAASSMREKPVHWSLAQIDTD